MIGRELIVDGVEVSLEIATASETLRVLSNIPENVDLLYMGGLLEDIANHILDMSDILTNLGMAAAKSG